MEKITFLALFLLTISTAHLHYYTSKPGKLQTTHLRFFLHDTLSGAKPSAVQIAGPNTSNSDDPVPFGTLFVIDDVLTEGPEITSKVIGNARGMYISSSQGKDSTLLLCVDLGFTTGKYNGSSLSVFSRNPIMANPREFAVVGGRGLFRRAQGVLFAKTWWANYTSGDGVVEYNVEVVHP